MSDAKEIAITMAAKQVSSAQIGADTDAMVAKYGVDEAELNRRRNNWVRPKPRYEKGVLGKYSRLVSTSSKGAVTDQT